MPNHDQPAGASRSADPAGVRQDVERNARPGDPGDPGDPGIKILRFYTVKDDLCAPFAMAGARPSRSQMINVLERFFSGPLLALNEQLINS